jgi:hypothetical protein
MKLKQGQYVRHSKYGWGTIIDCEHGQTTVYFTRVGVTRLTDAEAVFKIVEDRDSLKRRAG